MVALPVRGVVAPSLRVGAPPLGVVAPLVRLGVRVRVGHGLGYGLGLGFELGLRLRLAPNPPRLHGRKRSHSRLVAACRASTE